MVAAANPLSFLARLDVPLTADFVPEIEVNAHIHLPPNFSSLPDAVTATRLAREEGVRILGISNYYGVETYCDFADACLRRGVFPLFGLEIILHDESLARSGWRVNDPQNPGKIYLCGRGLTALEPTEEAHAIYGEIAALDTARAHTILDRLGAHAARCGVGLKLSYDRIAAEVAARHGIRPPRVVLQERHLAAAVVAALEDGPPEERRARWLKTLGAERDTGDEVAAAFDAAEVTGPGNPGKLQDLVRKWLLKIGRPAYVGECYISFDKGRRLIAELGGAPVYPVLADGAKPICEFEREPEELAWRLEEWDIWAVEFIPTRNAPETLTRYVEALDARGFWMTAGTEHNTPRPAPMLPACKDGVPIPKRVRALFRRGAFILAAHQYLCARSETGLDPARNPGHKTLDELAALGARVVKAVVEKGPT